MIISKIFPSKVFIFWEFYWYMYSSYSRYSDRQAWANIVDPDQTPQNAASDQGQQFPTDSAICRQINSKKIDLVNFLEQDGYEVEVYQYLE